jgi:hypothetical protein
MTAALVFDLGLATRALAGAGADAADGLLREIQDLSSRGDYRPAAERAAGALPGGCTDVRVLAPFLLGAFLEQGPEAVPGVLGVLRSALSDRWTALRPEAKKPRVVDSALSWLFRSMVVQIDFHEKMQDATFRAWAGADAATVGRPSLEASTALRAAIDAVIDKARSTVQLSEVEVRVRSLWSRPPSPPPLVAAPPVVTAPVAAPPPEPAPEPTPLPAPALTAPAAAPALEISPPMQSLLRKLEAFEVLVARGDLERAAVVAEDVRSTLESFDPRLYFPRLFSSYARVLAAHVNDIAPHWESIGSPPWRALEQLYRVDLDAFLDG